MITTTATTTPTLKYYKSERCLREELCERKERGKEKNSKFQNLGF
jgi:hypothetical protein